MSLTKLQQRKRDFKITFGSDEGKRVLNYLIRANHILEPTFSVDAIQYAFNEGRRNAVLEIMSVLHYRPDDFLQLASSVEENKDE